MTIKSKIFYGIAVGIFLMCIFLFKCSAQDINFTHSSKPFNAGRFIRTGSVQIDFDFKSDDSTHVSVRSVPLFNYGSVKVAVQYPYLIFNNTGDNWQIPLKDMVGYSTIMDKSWHKLKFRITPNNKCVLVDTIILASKNASVAFGESADLIFGSTSNIDVLTGRIKNINCLPAPTPKNEFPQPAPKYDERNIIPGYTTGNWSNVASLYDQLVAMPAPKYFNAMPKIRPLFNMRYFAEFNKLGVTVDSAINAAVMIDSILCAKFNCTLLVIDNTQDFYDYLKQPSSWQNKFNMAIIALANRHPEWEIEIGIGLAVIHSEPALGYYHITEAQRDAMLPNQNLSVFEGDRQILNIHLRTLKEYLTHPFNYCFIDNEYYNKYLGQTGVSGSDSTYYLRFPDVVAAKNASGLSWWEYSSTAYTNAVNFIKQDFKTIAPEMQVSEYDVNSLGTPCKFYYDALFNIRVGLNHGGRGSTQIYPRKPFYCLVGSGDYRGVDRLEQTRLGEVANGNNLYIPFIQVGSTGIPEEDMNPSLSTGLATFMIGAGAYTIHPSVFITGGMSIEPKAFAWQMTYCSYAQASFSKYSNILLNGVLMNGDNSIAWQCFGNNDMSFRFFGDYECKAEVVKLGNAHLITTFHGSATNYKYDVNKKDGYIYLYGVKVPLGARPQGSVYYYDSSKAISDANPVLINSWVKFGISTNW